MKFWLRWSLVPASVAIFARSLPMSLLLAVQIGSGSAEHLSRTYEYSVKGVWSDACPCHLPCPCWKTEKANVKQCLNVQVFHVSAGHYKGSDISGSTFVLLGVPKIDYGGPYAAIVYLDSKLPKVFHPHVNNLFRDVFGLIPEQGVQTALIDATIGKESHKVIIPDMLAYEVGPPSGGPPESLSADVEGFLYPWLSHPRQWRTRHVRYQTAQGTVEYRDTNSLVGEFDISPAKRAMSIPGIVNHVSCSMVFRTDSVAPIVEAARGKHTIRDSSFTSRDNLINVKKEIAANDY